MESSPSRSESSLNIQLQFIAALLLGLTLSLVCSTFPLASISNPDWSGYWSATQLFINGENPYSLSTLGELQQSAIPSFRTTIPVWNPPALFILLLPFTFPSYPLSEFLWRAMSVVFLMLSVSMLLRLFSKSPKQRVSVVLFCFGFPIVLKSIYDAQITPFLFLLFATALVTFKHRYYFLSGMLLGATLVKPHFAGFSLFYLLLAGGLRGGVMITGGVICSASILSGLAELVFPGIHHLWLWRQQWPELALGSTASSVLRVFFSSSERSPPLWPGFIPPIFGLGITVFIWLRDKQAFRKNWLDGISRLIPVYSLVSPYGFIYEQVMLIATLVWFVMTAKRAEQTLRLYSVVLLANVLYGSLWGFTLYLHPLSWFVCPLLMLLCVVVDSQWHRRLR